MINTNILNILKSNSLDPSYSVIITDFKQPEFCDRDQLQIVVQQISPSFFDIINQQTYNIDILKQTLSDNNIAIPDINEITINNIVSKTFSIESSLNFNSDSSMFTSQLLGNIINEKNLPTPSSNIEGYITKRRINITNKDSPVILNLNSFEIKNKQIIISVDTNKINNISATLSHDDIHMIIDQETITIPFGEFVFNEITDDKLVIDINDIINDLIDCDVLNQIQAEIDEYNDEINQSNDPASDMEIERDILIQKYNRIVTKLNGLNFSSNDTFNINIDYTLQSDISDYHIESIGFKLDAEIDIDFIHKYINMPAVIITIDKKDKIYSSYDTTFKFDQDNKYSGVKINFNKLRKIKDPIQVNAIIIGDNGV